MLPQPHDPDLVQRMVGRFARAHWIAGTNIETPDFLSLDFTSIGQSCLDQIREAIRHISPDLFKDAAIKLSRNDSIRLDAISRFIARDLEPPPLSRDEATALLTVAMLFSTR